MLRLHRSERADALIAPLADVLADAPVDAFALDVVAVPTRGVERWLAQRLSHHLGAGAGGEGGIAAAIRFDSPGRLLDDVAQAALGTGRGGDDDPWSRDRLTWHLLDVVDACAGEPWCSPLGRHLGTDREPDDVRRGRRMQVAAHLAALFTSYGTQRPDMVTAWARGSHDDGTGSPVPADLDWQVRLWQRLRERLGTPSPAERLDDVVARLRDEPGAVDLPDRLSVFGATRLAEGRLRVLAALAEHRDVHLWLPHPSPALWDAVGRTHAGHGARPVRRAEVRAAAGHPLLASMARDVTELQLRVTATGPVDEVHHPAAEPPGTLLGALQRRLRDDSTDAAPHVSPHPLAADDDSVRVHACHGRSRQVEVLREVLIGLFDDDRTLEPRDVIVLCPDIEEFAPLVAATFGLAPDDSAGHEVHPGRSLRVRLADRSLRQTNPLLQLLSRLLEMADGRVTASDVVDLASSDPVRQRFRLGDEEVDRIRRWAVESGARWGENRTRRERFGLGHVVQGTWETALDRILLGAAMAEEDQRYVDLALPLDDVDSTDIDLAGRLAELVDRLTAVLRELDGARPAGRWLDVLDRSLDLLTGTAPADQWQAVEARAVLGDARRAAVAGGDPLLRLLDVRALLSRRLAGRPTRAGFRTGALTMCSMEPMRAVPHRVVVLLGMDDGAFPRGSGADGDDLLLRSPLVGERDRRGEDRQLFLDAIAAATGHLVVLHSGADVRTGGARPPAVPVGELLDALDLAATTGDPHRRVRDHVLVRHPLQTVDERNFTAGALGRPDAFSYDEVARRAAQAARGSRTGSRPFLDAPLAPDPGLLGDLDLDDLVRDLEHPVRAFLRRRLGVSLPAEAEDVEDRMPLTIGPLAKWKVGDRLLAAAVSGVDLGRARQVELRRGELPPRLLGAVLLDELMQTVEPIAAVARRHISSPARALDITVTTSRGRDVSGTVASLHGDVLVLPVYSKLRAKYRLRAWIQLLALAAATGRSGWRAVAVGQSTSPGARAMVSTMTAPSADEARDHLSALVALRDAALDEVLPLPLSAGFHYARSRRAGLTQEQSLTAAAHEFRAASEHLDNHHAFVWGEDAELGLLLAALPGPAERRGWPEDGTRFGVLSRRLWQPLLDHEHTETA